MDLLNLGKHRNYVPNINVLYVSIQIFDIELIDEKLFIKSNIIKSNFKVYNHYSGSLYSLII